MGMMQTLTCVVRTNDGEKPCRGKTDCEAACLYAGPAAPGKEIFGQCSKDSNLFGCKMYVESGAVFGLCAD